MPLRNAFVGHVFVEMYLIKCFIYVLLVQRIAARFVLFLSNSDVKDIGKNGEKYEETRLELMPISTRGEFIIGLHPLVSSSCT